MIRRNQSLDTECKLNLHKPFKRRLGRPIYVQFTSCVQGAVTQELVKVNQHIKAAKNYESTNNRIIDVQCRQNRNIITKHDEG